MSKRSCFLALLALSCGSTAWAAPKAKKENKAELAPATKPAPRLLTLHAVVFEDLNADGKRDSNENPLPDMPVSDGVTWAKTDAAGSCQFKLNEGISGCVFVSTPAGWRAPQQFFVAADFAQFGGKTQPGQIGLVRDPARNANRFSFVQVTDTHVTAGADTFQTMTDDLKVVNRFSDSPLFIAATGDLTNSGKETDQFANYARATQAAKYPYYNVVGNHDYGGQLRETENYETYLGPRYYSFTVGQYHFIAKDVIADMKDPKAAARQEKWIQEDLRLNAAGEKVIVFQHFLPLNKELDWWSQFNTAAIFSGHWHGRRERLYKGILDVNSATFRFGGIDRSPRGFRIVHLDGDKITCEWRAGQQDKRVEVISPANAAAVAAGKVHLQVLAYDTAVRVKQATYRLELAGNSQPLTGKLTPGGRWMWTADVDVPATASTAQASLKIDVLAADESTWHAESSFRLDGQPAAAPKMGQPWNFFHGDAGHRGYLAEGPKPPLTMAWSTNVGGTILLASPVIADNKVYVGTGFSESLDDCAVHALDLATGRPVWRAPVDSSIQHSLAAWNGNVFAVSQAARLYCLASDGSVKWNASLAAEDSNRWELSFPVTDGKVVYAGRCNGFGAYAMEDGKPIWRQPGGADWWPSVYSGPSIGTGLIYQGGAFTRALDPATGKIVWNLPKTVVSTVAVVPAVVERNEAGDRLYVFENGKTLLCLDGKDGKTIWQASHGPVEKPLDVPLGNETGTPAVGDKIVCIGGGEVKWPGEDKESAAMHGLDKKTGRLLWRFPVGAGLASSIPYKRGESTVTSSPVIVGDVVYFGANDGLLYALDVNTGKPLWQYRLGVPIASTVAVSGNTVAVAAWDGTVYAFTAR